MITRRQYEKAAKRALGYFKRAGVRLTAEEAKRVEVADFALGKLDHVGLQLFTYVNTERVCAKEMVLFPGQTCPEHMHADGGDYAGKEETFRCRKGEVYLYVPGAEKAPAHAKLPQTSVSVFHEIVLREGEQYTLSPNTWHWFQAGKSGAVISEFSTRSRDESDLFTDERIRRAPEVEA